MRIYKNYLSLLPSYVLALFYFCFFTPPLLCESLESQSYFRSLDSVTYNSREGENIVLIKLSDESVWRWTPDMYSENLLQTWKQGDPIIIRSGDCSGFFLYNPSHPHYLPTVSLPSSSYFLYPTLSHLSKEGSTLTLSDDSIWRITCEFSKKDALEWVKEDRIIPVQEAWGDYYLINLNIPYHTREKIERALSVETLLPTLY